RFSSLGLILTSCVAGIAYYLGVAVATGPVLLIVLQVLNAWCFAGIGGVGLTLFQQMIRRPGLSTGLYMNTRRVGAILSGPPIPLGGATARGQRATFLACAVLTLVGLLIIAVAGRRSSQSVATEPPSTRQFEPTTNEARPEHRTAITEATSSGSPRRSSSRSGRSCSRREPLASSRCAARR